MRGVYLHNNVFYSFWFRSSSRQHPAFEMYICDVVVFYLFVIYCFYLCVSWVCAMKIIQNGRERVLHAKRENIPEGEGAICTMYRRSHENLSPSGQR